MTTTEIEAGHPTQAGQQPAVCPECGAPAQVVDRFVLASTHGPVEHWRLRCTQRTEQARHHYVGPVR